MNSGTLGEFNQKKKIIFDTDPGLDDAIALFFLMGRRDVLDPLAVTTVFGNVDIDKTTNNALRLLRFLGINNVPVHRGVSTPLIRDRVSGEMIHGQSGLGDTLLPEPVWEITSEDEHAAMAMARKVRAYPGQVKVITVGPMTNLALAIRLYPEIVEQIDEVIIMGGAMGQGNRTASAEYNVFADPHAANIVFNSQVSLVMLGLDVTERTKPGEYERKFFQNINHPAAQVTLEFMDFFKKQMNREHDMALHDACAVAYALNPNIFKTRKMHVDVELTGTHTLGRTICQTETELDSVSGDHDIKDENKEKYNEVEHKEKQNTVQVAVDIDREQFFRELFSGYLGLEKD